MEENNYWESGISPMERNRRKWKYNHVGKGNWTAQADFGLITTLEEEEELSKEFDKIWDSYTYEELTKKHDTANGVLLKWTNGVINYLNMHLYLYDNSHSLSD